LSANKLPPNGHSILTLLSRPTGRGQKGKNFILLATEKHKKYVLFYSSNIYQSHIEERSQIKVSSLFLLSQWYFVTMDALGINLRVT
jgi:hypothetical protein